MTPLDQIVLANQLYAEGAITFTELAAIETDIKTGNEDHSAFMRWTEAVGDRLYNRLRGRLKGETQ